MTKSCTAGMVPCLDHRVVDGQGLGRRQVVIAGELLRVGRRIVGVAFDADDVLGKILPQVGRDAHEQLLGVVFHVRAAWHEQLIGGNFDAQLDRRPAALGRRG